MTEPDMNVMLASKAAKSAEPLGLRWRARCADFLGFDIGETPTLERENKFEPDG
jgi:hypothetical protein